eukprot:12912479-Prorocentrum_lima.AAC.1
MAEGGSRSRQPMLLMKKMMRMKRTLSIQRLSMKMKMSSMLHHSKGMDVLSKVAGIFKIRK